MRPQNINLGDLLLDPNNYRLQEQDEFIECAEDRFHLERVQSGTLRRMQRENIRPLRDSIVSNGFLEIERIVVTPYAQLDGKYVVIEGNRRVAALLQIRDEHEGGIDIPEAVVRILDDVPCIVADGDGQEGYFRQAIMGIRHVGGIKEWGGFQRAKLIADLKDVHDLDAQSIAARLGLNVQEVNRRYRAFKALDQMRQNETYGEFARPNLYPMFHEAVSLPAVRDWLGWNQNENLFQDEDRRELFYQLLVPRNLGQEDQKGPKLTTYSDVRQLKDVLANDDAKASLLDFERELVDAISVVNQDKVTRRWRNEISEARAALQKIPGLEIAEFDADDIAAINALIEVARLVIQLHERAQAAGE